MGPLYDTCKKCYSSSGSAETCAIESRESWFEELADSSVKCISYHAFEAYAKDRIEHVAYEFTKIDTNGDGCIDRTEFGV
jgi:Ca2+-binding EF-hand superfamily protein